VTHNALKMSAFLVIDVACTNTAVECMHACTNYAVVSIQFNSVLTNSVAVYVIIVYLIIQCTEY